MIDAKYTWSMQKWKMRDLVPQQYNPRILTRQMRKHLKDSMDKFGCVQPIVVSTEGVIIGGHQRYAILKDRKVLEVDCITCSSEMTNDDMNELGLRLNRNHADWNYDILSTFHKVEDLLKLGFSMQEFQLESIPDKPDALSFVMTINFGNEDDLHDAESKIATMIQKYPGSCYKVKIK